MGPTRREGEARAPHTGSVEHGEQVGQIGEVPVCAPLTGWLRGLSHDGAWIERGKKVVEVAARDDPASFQSLGERPRRIAEGVLAVLADAGSASEVRKPVTA